MEKSKEILKSGMAEQFRSPGGDSHIIKRTGVLIVGFKGVKPLKVHSRSYCSTFEGIEWI